MFDEYIVTLLLNFAHGDGIIMYSSLYVSSTLSVYENPAEPFRDG